MLYSPFMNPLYLHRGQSIDHIALLQQPRHDKSVNGTFCVLPVSKNLKETTENTDKEEKKEDKKE